jgi:crotonobetainyl-CoA:carnitine CoA-transferase CaiB-like acyl-CoA transferase
MNEAPALLAGLRVLSFCHYLQGPAASQYLADMGADVVKVEPLSGAFERNWSGADTFVQGVSAFFLCGNRNKRSLSVDLKQEEGRSLILKLVGQFDVVLENYRPGVMDRLGLGYDELRKINPRLIYASASGFGSSGPLRDRPGQDLLVQARTGLVAATGDADRSPTAVGCAAMDQHGAALLAMGILGAYVRRLKTGVGTRVEASLFNAGIDLQAEALTLYYSGARNASVLRRDSHLATWFHAAPYGVYRLADAHIVLSLNAMPTLAHALGNDELAGFDGCAYEMRDELAARVAALLAPRQFAELAPELDASGIWYERVQDYDDLKNDPQAVHTGTFSEFSVNGGRATLVNHPLRYDGGTPRVRHLAIDVGQDTADVLAEAGVSPAEIERLARDGVVRVGSAEAAAAGVFA